MRCPARRNREPRATRVLDRLGHPGQVDPHVSGIADTAGDDYSGEVGVGCAGTSPPGIVRPHDESADHHLPAVERAIGVEQRPVDQLYKPQRRHGAPGQRRKRPLLRSRARRFAGHDLDPAAGRRRLGAQRGRSDEQQRGSRKQQQPLDPAAAVRVVVRCALVFMLSAPAIDPAVLIATAVACPGGGDDL